MPLARIARPEDAEILARIHAACFAESWNVAEMASWLAMPAVVAVAAFEGSAATGFILALAAADQAEILTFGVDPARQRQGIGRALLGALEVEMARRGARSLYLDAAEDNAAALALYRSAGFAEATRRRNYYIRQGDPADAIVMVKSLGID